MAAMRKLLLFVVASVASVNLSAQDTPLSREDFLKSKVPEVLEACHRAIIATAKDPTSVQFLGGDTYGLGRVITRNFIFITVPIMGRNTYGAVLRHDMTCEVSCTQKKGCGLPRVTE